jgi:hypothetical protein
MHLTYPHESVHKPEGQAGDDNEAITKEMIEAGEMAYYNCKPLDSYTYEEICIEIYRAMRRVATKPAA